MSKHIKFIYLYVFIRILLLKNIIFYYVISHSYDPFPSLRLCLVREEGKKGKGRRNCLVREEGEKGKGRRKWKKDSWN